MGRTEIDRRAPRRAVTEHIQCRIDGRTVMVTVHDLSEGGCQLEGLAGWAHEGSRVVLKIGGFQCPPGRIAWLMDRSAGVAFEGSLHPAILDRIAPPISSAWTGR